MKQYKIYKHPAGTTEAIKLGWSWPAFFFGFIWAFVKKLYVIATIALIITVVLIPYGYSAICNILDIAAAVFLGVFGNRMRESNMIQRGYDLIETVNAESPEGAIGEYLKGQTIAGERIEPFVSF